jgi:AcrR family transcriptional regulator
LVLNFNVIAVEFYTVDIILQATAQGRSDIGHLEGRPMARTGRRPGAGGDTKEAIHAAARRQFGEHGYEATTIRGVAAEAGVDPALVMHFFGSKDALFAACVEWPFDPDEEVPNLLAGKRSQLGERLVTLFVETWDQEAGRSRIINLLRTALSQEPAQRLFREFLTTRFFGPLVAGTKADRPELRADLAASQLVGLGMIRYVLRFEPLASLPPESVVALVAPAVQRYLTGRLPDARG